MKNLLIASIALAAVGCGSQDAVEETKPSQVQVNIPKEQQDKIAADLKNFVPDKKR